MNKQIGFSSSAKDLMSCIQEFDARYTPTFLKEHPELVTAIVEAYEQSQHDEDDDCDPVPDEVVQTAFSFLDSLPVDLPSPEVCAEQDGSLALTWEWSPTWILMLSIGPKSKCYWAALFGREEIRGAFTFYGARNRSLLAAISRFK